MMKEVTSSWVWLVRCRMNSRSRTVGKQYTNGKSWVFEEVPIQTTLAILSFIWSLTGFPFFVVKWSKSCGLIGTLHTPIGWMYMLFFDENPIVDTLLFDLNLDIVRYFSIRHNLPTIQCNKNHNPFLKSAAESIFIFVEMCGFDWQLLISRNTNIVLQRRSFCV